MSHAIIAWQVQLFVFFISALTHNVKNQNIHDPAFVLLSDEGLVQMMRASFILDLCACIYVFFNARIMKDEQESPEFWKCDSLVI